MHIDFHILRSPEYPSPKAIIAQPLICAAIILWVSGIREGDSRLNTGGWLLLSLVFGTLLLIVQRSERKRRNVTLIILLFVGFVVWRYALYRMLIDCNELFAIVCRAQWYQQARAAIAYNTINAAILTALIANLLFWIFFGRSNPPGTSESIYVYGLDDKD
jgi:hypothetical protein